MYIIMVVYSPDIHDYAYSTDFIFFPQQGGCQCRLSTIDPILDLYIRCSLWLGGLRQCTSDHDKLLFVLNNGVINFDTNT